MILCLLAAFITVGILLILLILVQRSRGGGFSKAFAGRGVENSLLGTRTGDVFTALTAACFLIFLGLAIWLNLHWH